VSAPIRPGHGVSEFNDGHTEPARLPEPMLIALIVAIAELLAAEIVPDEGARA
jgi:hypothetical protein